MICVNELSDMKCNKKEILEPLLILISPFAPHIAEELWSKIGNKTSIYKATFPTWDESKIVETKIKYPVSFNGKMRFILEVDASASIQDVEKIALNAPESQKWLENKTPKKVIVVHGKIVNIVL